MVRARRNRQTVILIGIRAQSRNKIVFFFNDSVLLGNLLLLFQLFHFVDQVATKVAQYDFGVFANFLGQLYILFAAEFSTLKMRIEK